MKENNISEAKPIKIELPRQLYEDLMDLLVHFTIIPEESERAEPVYQELMKIIKAQDEREGRCVWCHAEKADNEYFVDKWGVKSRICKEWRKEKIMRGKRWRVIWG